MNLPLPQLVCASDIRGDETKGILSANVKGRWVPVRGIRPTWLKPWTRLKLAWMVFTGRADAVTWEA